MEEQKYTFDEYDDVVKGTDLETLKCVTDIKKDTDNTLLVTSVIHIEDKDKMSEIMDYVAWYEHVIHKTSAKADKDDELLRRERQVARLNAEWKAGVEARLEALELNKE